jgi:hypothetical protein
MGMLIVLASIIQSLAVSLGVGSSTLAITNFFVAIADGRIDANERKMMGIVYIVLRVAMILILLTTIAIALYNILVFGRHPTSYIFSQWTLIAVLFGNAFLMTKHKMPSTIGPALQASTWYTLGVLLSLLSLNLIHFTYMQFVLGYCAAIVLAVSIVNGVMSLLKKGKQK